MEVFEAMGTRRSFRFYKPWKEVEDWKIQKMLQAARYCSCQGNCNSTEAIVIDKRTYPPEKFEKIVECGSAFNEIHLRQAPIIVAWLINLDAWYKELIQTFQVLFPARAITAAHGWTYKILTESTYPRLMSFPKDRAEDLLRVEAGQAIANAMLAATDMGLGCCLIATGRKPAEFPKVLGTPENIVPIWLMTVGYAAEDPGRGRGRGLTGSITQTSTERRLRRTRTCGGSLSSRSLYSPWIRFPEGRRSLGTYAGCSVSRKTCATCRRIRSLRCTRRNLPITESFPRALRKGESEKSPI